MIFFLTNLGLTALSFLYAVNELQLLKHQNGYLNLENYIVSKRRDPRMREEMKKKNTKRIKQSSWLTERECLKWIFGNLFFSFNELTLIVFRIPLTKSVMKKKMREIDVSIKTLFYWINSACGSITIALYWVCKFRFMQLLVASIFIWNGIQEEMSIQWWLSVPFPKQHTARCS